jgi:nucleotide-binding universal stress UspA family protein
MGPVIACVDGSDVSRPVVRIAQQLAERLEVGLVLLHVAPPTEAPGVSAAPAGQQRLHEAEKRDAEKLLEGIALEEGQGADVPRRAEIGRAATRIVDACAEEHAELVVFGSRGRSEMKSALLGSVSTSVASHAPCPCVIVSNAAERPFLVSTP